MIRQVLARRPARSGFTLTELLVVIAILAVIAGLVVVAVLPTFTTAKLRNTRTLLQKLDDAINQKWKAVGVKPPPNDPAYLPYASGDAERAKVIQRAAVLKQNFPMSFAEVLAPEGLPAYKKLIGQRDATKTQPQTESAVCLLMALRRQIDGRQFNVEEVLGADAIRDTDGDGLDEIVDGWGNPIQFYRWGCYDADLQAVGSKDTASSPDPLDPDRKLIDPNWHQNNPSGVQWFQANFYPITASGSPFAYYSKPITVSMGKDGQLGLGAFAQVIDAALAEDNVYSFKLK